MNFFRPVLLTSFVVLLLVVLGSEGSPQRNYRTNRRLAKQEVLDGSENEITTTMQPIVYSNNNPNYGGFGGYGGFQPGFSFLPPPLMMMMMMRNGAMGRALFGPDGIDMNTVQRVLQGVVNVLQEIEQEKQANPGTGGNQGAATGPVASQLRRG